MLIETLAGFGISAQRIEGRTGVWVDQRKIASIGVAVRSWVTFHGFALNVSTDLSGFDAVNPCGYESRIMTSITKELGRSVPISEVKRPLTGIFARIFDTELERTDLSALELKKPSNLASI
jgi:lipoate-protein ligase B